jgi:hypothetical protein
MHTPASFWQAESRRVSQEAVIFFVICRVLNRFQTNPSFFHNLNSMHAVRRFKIFILIQGDSLATGPKLLSIKALKCAWMRNETIFSIDYEHVLFYIVSGMCI